MTAAANNGDAKGMKRAADKTPKKKNDDNNKTSKKKMKKTAKNSDAAVKSVTPKKQETSKIKNQKGTKAKNGKPEANATCSFPMSRVWRLIRGEGGGPITDSRTTSDAVFLINKASEMFLEHFAGDAYAFAARGRGKSITYNHLSSTVCNGKRYEFLSDFVPEKIKAEDALRARELVET